MQSMTLLALLALAAPMQSQVDDEQAKTKIADFKKTLKTVKTDADMVAALTALAESQNPKILAEIKGFLGKGNVEVAIASAELISKYKKDKDAAEALMTAAGGRKEKDVIVKCLRYAGDTEYRPIAAKMAGFLRHRELDIAREAVDSLAKLKAKDGIDPLLSLWKELDGIRDDVKNNDTTGGGLGNTIGGSLTNSMQDEQVRRKQELTPAVMTAFEKTTGESLKTMKEANDWWRKNKATFKEVQ